MHTWANTPARFQARIIGRIRSILEERIAKDRRGRVESTVGYTDNVDALSRGFGIDLEQAESQAVSIAARARSSREYSQQGSEGEELRHQLASLTDLVRVRTPADSPPGPQVGELGSEDGGNESLGSI